MRESPLHRRPLRDCSYVNDAFQPGIWVCDAFVHLEFCVVCSYYISWSRWFEMCFLGRIWVSDGELFAPRGQLRVRRYPFH